MLKNRPHIGKCCSVEELHQAGHFSSLLDVELFATYATHGAKLVKYVGGEVMATICLEENR